MESPVTTYISSLPTVPTLDLPLLEDDTGETECIICKDEYTASDTHGPVRTSCGHVFGRSCLKSFLGQGPRNNFCPLCSSRLIDSYEIDPYEEMASNIRNPVGLVEHFIQPAPVSNPITQYWIDELWNWAEEPVQPPDGLLLVYSYAAEEVKRQLLHWFTDIDNRQGTNDVADVARAWGGLQHYEVITYVIRSMLDPQEREESADYWRKVDEKYFAMFEADDRRRVLEMNAQVRATVQSFLSRPSLALRAWRAFVGKQMRMKHDELWHFEDVL